VLHVVVQSPGRPVFLILPVLFELGEPLDAAWPG